MVVAHAFRPSTWEAEASLVHREFQDSQVYTEKTVSKEREREKRERQRQRHRERTLPWDYMGSEREQER